MRVWMTKIAAGKTNNERARRARLLRFLIKSGWVQLIQLISKLSSLCVFAATKSRQRAKLFFFSCDFMCCFMLAAAVALDSIQKQL